MSIIQYLVPSTHRHEQPDENAPTDLLEAYFRVVSSEPAVFA